MCPYHHSKTILRNPPSFPPPLIPARPHDFSPYLVQPSFLRNYAHSVFFVWLATGESFWLYPTALLDTMLNGYRWVDQGWAPIELNWHYIQSFY